MLFWSCVGEELVLFKIILSKKILNILLVIEVSLTIFLCC